MKNRRWWRLLALLLFAPAPLAAQQTDTLSLSLEQSVARTLSLGDEILLARAQAELADAQFTVARASALPQLRLSSTYTHVLENARAQAVGQIFNQPNTYNTNVNLSQSIFQGGRVFAGARAAGRLRDAARMNAQEVRNQAAFDVQQAYLQALFAQQLFDIQRANLELADAQLRQVSQFESSGRAARYDVLRARVQRANIEPLLIQARSDVDLTLLELKRIANVPAQQPVRLTTVLDPDAVQAMVVVLEQDVVDIDNRPSVRAARLTAQARRDAVRIARADWLPTINVFLQTGFQAFPASNTFPTERGRIIAVDCPPGSQPDRSCVAHNGGWFPDRSIGVQLSWPLFDGLRAKGNIDAAQAQVKVADLLLAQEREQVALEIEQAKAGYESAKALFAARQQNAGEASEAFRLASLRFNRGLSTQLDVSDAQIALMTARTNEARAVYDLYLAAADLARAQGKPIPLPYGTAGNIRQTLNQDEK